MLRWLPALLVALLLIFLAARQFTAFRAETETGTTPSLPPIFDPAFLRMRPALVASTPRVTRLTAPLGGENGALTYNAQPFLMERHLGDDLNGIGGWNSDFGDPVFAIGNGLVTYAGNPAPGWGRSIAIAHRNDPEDPTSVIQSFYSHLSGSNVSVGEPVAAGDAIGEVGTADGHYLAHLHLEIRKGTTGDPGTGYHHSPLNRLSPSLFLENNAPSPADSLLQSILHILNDPDPARPAMTISDEPTDPGPGRNQESSAAREPQQ